MAIVANTGFSAVQISSDSAAVPSRQSSDRSALVARGGLMRRVAILTLFATLGVALALKSAAAGTPAAAAFVGSIGVNIHSTYSDTAYAHANIAINDLKYLGVTHVRDANPAGQGGGFLNVYAKYMRAGMSYDMIVYALSGNLTADFATLDMFAASRPGSIASIEGPNEVDDSYNYGGATGALAGAMVEKQIATAHRSDPLLAPLGSLMFTFGSWDQFKTVGDMSPYVTHGNAHIYYQSQAPSIVIGWALPKEAQTTPGMPMVVSETGYASEPGVDPDSGSTNVTEDVQARYTLDLLFDNAVSNVSATYLYELLDEQSDPANTNSQYHFGLFRNDGSAKPVATAIHNLTQILADPVPTVGLNAPVVTLSNLPVTKWALHSGQYYEDVGGKYTVFAKSNGRYDVVIWAEPALWDCTLQAQIRPTPSVVKVALSRSYSSVAVFDPMLSATTQLTLNNTNAVSVYVSDHPVIVELTP